MRGMGINERKQEREVAKKIGGNEREREWTRGDEEKDSKT